MCSGDARRRISRFGRRAFDDRSRDERDGGGGNSDLRTSSAAVTETATLSRLAVTALIVVGMPRASAL